MQYAAKKSMARGFILLGLGLSVLGLTYFEAYAETSVQAEASAAPVAAAAPECSLPFCDIPASLAGLRAGAPAARHEKLLEVLELASRETNPRNIANIMQWGQGMKALTIELVDEHWLVNEAKALINICAVRITFYSAPDAAVLMGYLRQLPYDTDRRMVYEHWILRMDSIEERAALLQVTQFFSEAVEYSTEREDDDYVVQLAKNGEQKAATKLFRLQPLVEGVYEARLTCVGMTDQAQCPSRLVDRLIIYDSLTPLEGIVAQFVSTRLSATIEHFSLLIAGNGGTTFEAAVATNRVARLRLNFNLVTREVTGEIQTTESLIRVVARPIGATPIQVFNERHDALLQNPLTTESLAAEATGTFGDVPAKMRIHLFDPETVGATLLLGTTVVQPIRFGLGRFYPRHGIFTFISDTIRGGVIKLTMAVVPQNNQYRVYGIGFHTGTGSIRRLEMTLPSPGVRPVARPAPRGVAQ